MKELTTFTSRFEASIFAQQLDEAGIAYIIQSNDGSGMFPVSIEIEPVKIMVSENDFDRAKKFVDE
jgi:hypothetical protein